MRSTQQLAIGVVLCLLLLLTLSMAGAVPVTIQDTNYAIPGSGVYYVATTGSNSNAGTLGAPFLTLAHAIATASTGNTIVLREGTYREAVTISGKTLTLQPYPHEQVWLKGSVVVTGWTADGSQWRKDGWTTQFTATTDNDTIDANYPMARYPDQVFIDGVSLTQVASKNATVSGTFYVDYTNAKLYIGDNPAGKTVEASVHPVAASIVLADGTTIRGLGIVHYAPNYNTNQYAAIRGDSNDLVFEANTFAYNANRGLAIFGTDAIVRRNHFLYNGEGGLGGHASHRMLVEGNYVAFNNTEHFAVGWDANGMKVSVANEVIWRDNIVTNNLGGGLWCDWACHDNQFVRNLIRDNIGHSGISYEKSAGGIIASNVFVGNTNGVAMTGSNNTEAWNNTFIRNGMPIFVADDDRRTGIGTAPGISGDNVMSNNLFANNDGVETRGLLYVSDFSADPQTGDTMVTSNNCNAYYRTTSTGPANLIDWARDWSGGGETVTHYTSLSAYVAAKTPREAQGLLIENTAVNPFFVNEATGNYALKATSVAKGSGCAIPQSVADAMNAGLATPITPVCAPVDRGALVWPEQEAPEQGDIVTNLELRWKMNENTGTTLIDATGKGHTGTLGASTAAPAWNSTCHHGHCLSFDGVNDVVTFTGIATTTNFTIAMWVFPASGSAQNYATLFFQEGCCGFEYMHGGGNALKLNFYHSGDHFSTGTLTRNAWNHVALVKNGGTATFYINGVASGTDPSAVGFTANRLGGWSGGEWMLGRLDEVWYFTRALAAADITKLMNFTEP